MERKINSKEFANKYCILLILALLFSQEKGKYFFKMIKNQYLNFKKQSSTFEGFFNKFNNFGLHASAKC
jgi:hypothetical protein